jgi:transposase
MLATSANGAGAADDAAAVRDDQAAVGEPGFVAGEPAAPERVPDPELVEWAERRSFTAKCKLEILAKLEAGTRLGEVGELLRREGLYTSHLTYWRKQVRDGALKELGKPRGGKPADRGAPQCAKLARACTDDRIRLRPAGPPGTASATIRCSALTSRTNWLLGRSGYVRHASATPAGFRSPATWRRDAVRTGVSRCR